MKSRSASKMKKVHAYIKDYPIKFLKYGASGSKNNLNNCTIFEEERNGL